MNIHNYDAAGLRKYISLWMLCLVALCVGACEDFVQVDLPDSQLNTTEVFADRATADAAMANIYAEMRSFGMLNGGRNGLSYQMGHYSDDFTFFATASSPTVPFFNNALLPSTPAVASWWNIGYSQVYATNALLEGVRGSDNLEQPDKDLLIGEALFARAMLHYYLNMVYGDVPFITSTDYEVNRSVSRLPSTVLYDTLVQDLQEAMLLLPEAYTTEERTRPNRYAAAALLARVQLAAGRWAEAADAAAMVINNEALYFWEGTLESEFLRDSRSTIWQFHPGQDGANTLEAQSFLFTSSPPTQYAVAQHLLDSFEPGDQRKIYWLSAVTGGVNTYYAVSKYKERYATASSVEYSVVLRLAEQVLIRAEARARQGELIGAAEDLNAIRAKAGLDPTEATTQQDILAAILKERQTELFAEYGHRFFDLRRFDMLDSELSPIKPGWESTDRLLPLPENEIILNPNLSPQNPGY